MNLIYDGKSIYKEIHQIFSETMEELFLENDKVIYLDADLMGSLKTKELWEKYPQNVFNCGIQEANMVGVASGLYLAGYKPYIHSFSPFATRRVFDQIFLSVAYAKKAVHIIGSDAGICATYNGGTHMCFEDVALIRSVPGSCIVDVSDATMFRYLLKQTKNRDGVTYFRTARRGLVDIYDPEETFEVGKGKVLKAGKDLTIIASGIMVATALEAARVLETRGIDAKVIDIITIKPLDKKLILDAAKETGAIITVENHNVIGGLGSAVSEFLSETYPVLVKKIGVDDQFGQVGCDSFLRKQYGLGIDNIVEESLKISHKNRKE